jgi:two-component system response regulator AtoC
MAKNTTNTTITEVSGGSELGPISRYLLVIGEGQMRTVPLPKKGEVVLGRDEACDVPLAHTKISRRHARVVVDRELAIEDLGSTNGIRVGGEKLTRGVPAALPLGESIRIGPFVVIALAGNADAASSADGTPRASVIVRDPTPQGRTELLERVARADVNVLIQGETGSGKEVLAQTVHLLSGRPGELVAINCAALSGTLLESELFGHEKGAFTGATRTKPGLLEVAGKGTALLDEIGDLPLELQGKLLRALESRQVYRVGGVQPIELHLRVLAATHKRLAEEVARGGFRQDLFFRLNGITLELPPLRERPEAIGPLAAKFLGAAATRLTPGALAALTAYDWPGNVRELKLVIERAVLLSGSGPIKAGHVLLSPARTAAPAPAVDDDRAQFLAAAREHKGNASAIARALNTSRSQVRRLAARYGVDLDALRT